MGHLLITTHLGSGPYILRRRRHLAEVCTLCVETAHAGYLWLYVNACITVILSANVRRFLGIGGIECNALTCANEELWSDSLV